jgi:hypothetical protein
MNPRGVDRGTPAATTARWCCWSTTSSARRTRCAARWRKTSACSPPAAPTRRAACWSATRSRDPVRPAHARHHRREFLREVRERWPDTVRIVISGYTDSEGHHRRHQRGRHLPVHAQALGARPPAADGAQRGRGTHAAARPARLDLELRTGTPVLRAAPSAAAGQARSTFDFDRIVRAPGSPLDALCEMAARVARYDLSVLVLANRAPARS